MQNSEVKENAARYLKEIVDILATVDKEMILIFKTLDLLRNISSTLGTQKRYEKNFFFYAYFCLWVIVYNKSKYFNADFSKLSTWSRQLSQNQCCFVDGDS